MNRNYDSGLVTFAIVTIGLAFMSNGMPSRHATVEQMVDVSNPVDVTRKSTGGGSSSTAVEVKAIAPEITNIKVCPFIVNDRWCTSTMKSKSNQVCIYWEVENGVGCCNTYGCNYERFAEDCLGDKVKLWEMRIDGEVYEPSITNYTYLCQQTVPWNWECTDGYDVGDHEVTIIHKDCKDVVAVETLQFRISSTDNETYIISYG